MAIAVTVDFEIALVIAARRHGAVAELDSADRRMLDARVADAHAPRRAVGLRSDDAHVAAEVHEPVRDAVFRADRRGAIGGVFLADAAEIELHAALRQPHVDVVPLDALPADQCARCGELAAVGTSGGRRRKSHARAQNARRQVEAPAAQAMAAVGVAQQRRRLGVDRHGATRRPRG